MKLWIHINIFSQLLVADPTDDEESLCLGRLTIVMNEEKICCIHKPGINLFAI